MVCMIADYMENGIDKHNEYIAPHTNDYEKAVQCLADLMERQGLSVSCITVCPDAKSFADLRRMAGEGIKPGNVFIPYIFEGGTARG